MFSKQLLARFGKDAESAKTALVRQLDLFGALPEDLAGVWLSPLEDGKWSPAETTEHVLKVNVGMSKTLRLLRQEAPLPELPRPGVLVGGKARSPAFALPGEPQPWAVLAPQWREMRRRFLAELEATEGSANGLHGPVWFHPYFGELDALGWVQAASLHMAHHRKQLSARP